MSLVAKLRVIRRVRDETLRICIDSKVRYE